MEEYTEFYFSEEEAKQYYIAFDNASLLPIFAGRKEDIEEYLKRKPKMKITRDNEMYKILKGIPIYKDGKINLFNPSIPSCLFFSEIKNSDIILCEIYAYQEIIEYIGAPYNVITIGGEKSPAACTFENLSYNNLEHIWKF